MDTGQTTGQPPQYGHNFQAPDLTELPRWYLALVIAPVRTIQDYVRRQANWVGLVTLLIVAIVNLIVVIALGGSSILFDSVSAVDAGTVSLLVPGGIDQHRAPGGPALRPIIAGTRLFQDARRQGVVSRHVVRSDAAVHIDPVYPCNFNSLHAGPFIRCLEFGRRNRILVSCVGSQLDGLPVAVYSRHHSRSGELSVDHGQGSSELAGGIRRRLCHCCRADSVVLASAI